ncbi:Rho termination factor N-terminal domain-containing protein [Stutzerimonas azotifigens]|uniref:Rho termination factor N-terminal domain-containing protein n=1 Tax=Stutzerimonas azotifigens TaxID=291995 RepID=UPI00040B1169|nr:Rho termination factor N-terminal domain-containing protein [Stutzerimonas azotifigens]
MPQGDKSKYTDKQKRKAEHIEESYEEKGVPEKEAEARAWATVNKQSGGGEREGGSGRRKSPEAKSAAREDSAHRAADARHGHPHNQGEASERHGKGSSSGRKSGGKYDSDTLSGMTKEELLKLARDRDLHGRSTMRKDELIRAMS